MIAQMNKRLLIVEDETPIAMALSLFFGSRGFEVDTAGTWAKMEACLAEHGYGIVIADLRLSGTFETEGLDIVSYVRERFPATKVILLTAYGSAEIEQEAWRRGVNAFLHKPQPLARIADIVSSLLETA
jgi:DNA-binding NtrC family response regulator